MHMLIKFLILLVCFILPFTEQSMRVSACVSQCAFILYATQRIKYGPNMRIFQGFIKNFFGKATLELRRLLRGVVMLLAMITFNLGSVLTKFKTLYLYTNVTNFFAINFGFYCFEIFTKFLKLGLKYLINRRFFLGL